jgi:hypothetical protein
MKSVSTENHQDKLISDINRQWKEKGDHILIAETIEALNKHYKLDKKIAKEPGVNQIMEQMFARLVHSFRKISNIRNKKILDIACGSNTSKAPALVRFDAPFGEISIGEARKEVTPLFEPWFCRILMELGAVPVGVDFGDLEKEAFTHYRVDLGVSGALDFLADHSFDGIQDSRLFGSPEFTAQFPHLSDRLKVAQEIKRQETRLLKIDGIIIHSDAVKMLKQ